MLARMLVFLLTGLAAVAQVPTGGAGRFGYVMLRSKNLQFR